MDIMESDEFEPQCDKLSRIGDFDRKKFHGKTMRYTSFSSKGRPPKVVDDMLEIYRCVDNETIGFTDIDEMFGIDHDNYGFVMRDKPFWNDFESELQKYPSETKITMSRAGVPSTTTYFVPIKEMYFVGDSEQDNSEDFPIYCGKRYDPSFIYTKHCSGNKLKKFIPMWNKPKNELVERKFTLKLPNKNFFKCCPNVRKYCDNSSNNGLFKHKPNYDKNFRSFRIKFEKNSRVTHIGILGGLPWTEYVEPDEHTNLFVLKELPSHVTKINIKYRNNITRKWASLGDFSLNVMNSEAIIELSTNYVTIDGVLELEITIVDFVNDPVLRINAYSMKIMDVLSAHTDKVQITDELLERKQQKDDSWNFVRYVIEKEKSSKKRPDCQYDMRCRCDICKGFSGKKINKQEFARHRSEKFIDLDVYSR